MEVAASSTVSTHGLSIPLLRFRHPISSTPTHILSFLLTHNNSPLRHSHTTPKKSILTPLLSSSSDACPPTESKSSPPPQGAKPIPFVLSISIGTAVFFLIPRAPELTPQAWQLLSIFLSTIAGLILSPLPVGAWAFVGLRAAVLTYTLSLASAFSAFSNEVIWLVLISFFFARGFVKTGLGDRITMYFVKWMGKSTLGLSYGLTLSEALLAPAMPSTTARAGGVFLPIIQSLSLSSGSRPRDPSSSKLGSFLVQSQFQQLKTCCA